MKTNLLVTRNEHKCFNINGRTYLKNAQTAVSSAIPKGVFCLHWLVRRVGSPSAALKRGVESRPSYMDGFAAIDAEKAEQ